MGSSQFLRSISQPSRLRGLGMVAALGMVAGCTDQRVDLSTYLESGDTGWNSRWTSPPPVLEENIQLIGMDASNVVALFGKPRLQRQESGAQYWRYSFGNCLVDIYVSRDDRGQRDEVFHYDLREPWKPARSVRGAYANSCAALERRLVRGPDSGSLSLAPRVESH